MKKHYALASVSILCWSTVATVIKLLLGSLSSMEILCISVFFAGLFLLVVNLITGNVKKMKAYKLKDYITMVLIGIPGTFLYYIFYYTGTSMMLASQAFIINYLWPIMSVIFALIILKEKLTRLKAVAIIISFVGVIIVTGKDLLAFNSTTLLGAMFCVLGAMSYGLFSALNQKFGYDKKISMMIFYFTSFTLTLTVNLLSGGFSEITPIHIIGFAYNGIFTMALANTCWMIALEAHDTAKISNLAYITPFLSLIWTAVFLKEEITLTSILGLLVIVSGILLQLFGKRLANKKQGK